MPPCLPLARRALALACLLAAPATAQAPPLDSLALEAAVRDEMAATSTPGVAVAVVRDGRVVYARGFGVTSVEDPRPVTAGTLFRIGSTTKVVTGMAALALAGAGRLDLHRPIGEVARGLHPALAARTTAQLLTHTGGLVSEGAADGPHDDRALGERVRGWDEAYLLAPPGDVFSYSGPSYWLAGYVVEQAAGEPFADAVRRHVLEPLGMRRSTFRPLVALTYPLALDHRVGPDGRATVLRPYADDVTTWASGSLFSTAEDMAALMLALLDSGRVAGAAGVAPAVVRGVTEAHAEMPGGGCAYTYGLAACGRGGLRTLGHYGFRVGSGSVLTMVPAMRAGVVILANRNGGIFARTEARALELLGVPAPGDEPPPPASPGPAPAGRYANGRDTLHVAERDGAAELRFRGAAMPMRYEPDGTLVATGPDGAAAFRFRVIRGRTTGAWYLTDGQVAIRRVEDPVARPSPGAAPPRRR